MNEEDEENNDGITPFSESRSSKALARVFKGKKPAKITESRKTSGSLVTKLMSRKS